jgi:hypothetical protein
MITDFVSTVLEACKAIYLTIRHFLVPIIGVRFASVNTMNNLFKYLIVLFSIMAVTNVRAQTTDTVAIRIQKITNPKTALYEWLAAANSNVNTDPELGFDYAGEALKLALKNKNVIGEGYCYVTFGSLHFETRNYKKATKYFSDALILFNGYESEKGYYVSTKNLAASLEQSEKFDQALEAYLDFEKLAVAKANEDDIIFAKNGIARCNQKSGNFIETENQYQQVFQMEQTRGNSSGYIQASNNLGNYYEVVSDSVQAFQYFDSSLNVAVNTGNTQEIANYYDNGNNYLSNRGIVAHQITFNEKALESNSITSNPTVYNSANLNLGKLNMSQNKPEQAITFLNNSIQVSDQTGEVEVQQEALEVITEAYKVNGEYDKALESYTRLISLQDSIQKEKNKQTLLASNLATRLEEKDEKIGLLQENDKLKDDKLSMLAQQQSSDQSFNNIVIFSLLALLFILSVASVIIWRANKERKQSNMLLELKSLRTQMNPHFIFNSLNSVNSFISKNDDRSANKYLSRFSKLMRMVLENSKYDFVTLASELQVLEIYIDLEHLRFQDKFEYTFEKDEFLDTEEIEIPPMLIQPYIENAVWHGLRYKDEKGKLTVSVAKVGTSLKWVIEDNGIGRKESAKLKTENQKKSKSTGMKNIESRLNILNQMNATDMRIKVIDLYDAGQTAAGTRVEIEIPFKEA